MAGKEGELLLEGGSFGTATVFSIILHAPLVVLLMHGTSPRERVENATPLLEAAYAGGRVQEISCRTGAALPEFRPGDPRTGPARRRLDAAGTIELPRLIERPALRGIAEKSRAPALPCLTKRAASAPNAGDRGQNWFNWYTREIRERIETNFPAEPLRTRGIHGEVYFQLRLQPDGGVRRVDVLRADHPALEEAVQLAVRNAQPFPGYRALGLKAFPPLNMTCSVSPR
ncbi:MAG: TonB family protein [Planctomycetes bacterium]|nr:TonB family protein [Planctomycetota bacterium]